MAAAFLQAQTGHGYNKTATLSLSPFLSFNIQSNMASGHKNKTIATFLASVFGSLGAHRFYLHGIRDFWAWAHFLTAPISVLAVAFVIDRPLIFRASLFIFSVLTGFIEALAIGLTPDDKWDVLHNHNSDRQSNSGWPLALLLVLTFGVGAVALIAMIARTFDFLYTGYAYG